jgi:hypothetical protein
MGARPRHGRWSRRAGWSAAGRCAALLVLAAVPLVVTRSGAAVVNEPDTRAAAPAAFLAADAAAPRDPQARPFDHRRHERISCRVCHGAGERHGASPRVDCAACHHARGAARCDDCHAGARLAGARAATQTLALGVWDAPRTRALPFEHLRHRTVACRDCHSTPVSMAVGVTCAGCHSAHHRAEADCNACHQPVAPATHPARAHLTCAGAACHAPGSTPSPAGSRALCVFCHEAQREHEPGSTCAGCHLIPADWPDGHAPGGGAWRQP